MLEAQLETIEGDIIAAEDTVAQIRIKEKDTRDTAGAARLKAKSLETEVATLIKLLKPAEAGRYKPIVDQISVTPGFEIALGAALGDDLDVTADQARPPAGRSSATARATPQCRKARSGSRPSCADRWSYRAGWLKSASLPPRQTATG